MNAAALPLGEPAGTPRAVAFGSLVDLARLQVGTPSAEICDACNTINIGSARYCKCCSHKLPAFYAATKDNTKGSSVRDAVFPWHSLGMPDRASMMDFAAFAVVINLLVVITASIPIP
ncbi:hypothetical protein QTH90_13640 [Variovorax sp. J2P1-59]|uniref:hypothetical protein n=1 Tax=Variovorax flavidus TaxID=3053501 RepID=UPI002577082D|nr:hypothetical protein [Variovorax sp. J2P1-59]MDM0075438.1 hypothetical protein [Variovorax sp. J2P1-59]